MSDELMRDILAVLTRHSRKMQYGGIVRRPTFAMLGENGPEAVVPMARGAFSTQRRAGGGVAAPTPGGTISGLLAGGQQALSDPRYLSRLTSRRSQRTADALRRRTNVLGRLSGLDPMQQRTAMVDADIAANQGLGEAINASELQGASGYQDFLRQLLMSERQAELEKQRRDEERGGIGGFLGQVAGVGLGSLAGGLGSRLAGGSRRSGGGGGGGLDYGNYI